MKHLVKRRKDTTARAAGQINSRYVDCKLAATFFLLFSSIHFLIVWISRSKSIGLNRHLASGRMPRPTYPVTHINNKPGLSTSITSQMPRSK